MGPSVEKVLAISGEPLGVQLAATGIPAALLPLLSARNGFYAFESALHVFPATGADQHLGVDAWNAPDLWRHEYGDLTDGCFFFAEDAFGTQFCLTDGIVATFDPETGDRSAMAATIEEWAERLLDDWRCFTGHPLAHAWQKRNRALQFGERLVPKIPFVGGGPYEVENLAAMDAVAGMRFRGNLARQFRDLPDGAKVRLVVTD